MRFLADECVPRPVVERLRQAGHDVAYVLEASPGIFDPQVLRRAGEDDCVLITVDRDFGMLVFAEWETPPTGVLHLRLEAISLSGLIDAVLEVVEDPEHKLTGYFTTVQPGKVRQRPLPS